MKNRSKRYGDADPFLIVETRKLTRPKTTMKKVWACLFILVAFYACIGLLGILIDIDIWIKVVAYSILVIFFNEFFLRYFGIVLIECYQHYASDDMRSTCKCVPSCSEYSILVLKKYPLIWGFIKILKRLNVTCDGSYKIDEP